MQRSVTAGSVLLGFVTYCTSLYWFEAYPDEIIIPIHVEKRTSSWDGPYIQNQDSGQAETNSQW